LRIDLPKRLIDYLFIGSLCGTSFIKAINFGKKKGILSSRGNPKSVRIFYFVLYLIFWPLGIIISLIQILSKKDENDEKSIKSHFIQWMGALLLGFFLILILNKLL